MKAQHTKLDTDQKTLEINLDEKIYGTFAEIGAGQEVARYFFKVGGSAGTIAKTMSAYDKKYSDEIYGAEPSGRYVCESRLYKMLNHEYTLMEERLQKSRKDTCFFVFADTVAAVNYQKTVNGNGWLGLRFQLTPNGKPNDIVIHVKMLDNDNQLQQSAIGILGVNLIYGCYYQNDDPEKLIQSLMDGLNGRVVIDMIRLQGPDFEHIDNRVLSLMLVKNGLSEVTMFGPNGQNMHPSEFLYKKSVMVVRGNYRPPTLVSLDVFKSAYKQFLNEEDVDSDKAYLLSELTLENLMIDGEIDVQDFLARAECLCALGQTVIISNCMNHQKLINYLSDFKIQKLGLVIGVNELLQIINNKYNRNRDGRLLVAFGELFTRNIKIYAYPVQKANGEFIKGSNMPVPEGIRFLHKYLLESKHLEDVDHYNSELLEINPRDILKAIQLEVEDWEKNLPEEVISVIKRKELFGFSKHKQEIEQ
jgi:hypothetical protein